MTLQEWLGCAEQRLKIARVSTPSLEAQLLASHVLMRPRAWVLIHGETEFPDLAGEPLLQRREAREPLAYILGSREFYSRDFDVGPGVLVPRQETEGLVDAVLELHKAHSEIQTCLDLGTGSGCIGITLALESDLKVVASDISSDALRYAKRTAERLGADIEFVHSDKFEKLSERSFDLIVTNPPYVREEEDIMPEASRYEPSVALLGGADGTEAYRWIAQDAPGYLKPGGCLLLETGRGMGEAVKKVFAEQNWEFVGSLLDLAGIERVFHFRRKE